LEDLSIGMRIILKWILKKENGEKNILRTYLTHYVDKIEVKSKSACISS
jgi:hypothetical protein